MHLFQKTVLVALIAAFTIACNDRKESGKVRISVKLLQGKNAKVDLVTNNALSTDTLLLASAKADTAGQAMLEVALDGPVFATIQSNNQYIPMLISPGDVIDIQSDTSKTEGGTKFTGDGASVHQHLKKMNTLQQKYEVIDGKYSIQVKQDEFIRRRDGLRKGYDSLFSDLSKDPAVTRLALQLIEKKGKMAQYFFHQNYICSQYSYNLNDPAIPATLKKVVQDLPDDSLAMATGIWEYSMMLSFYLQADIFPEVAKVAEKMDNDSLADQWATLTEQVIKKRKFSPRLENHFRAANLNYWVKMEGLSPELNAIRKDYYQEKTAAIYRKTLDESFARWEEIGPGKPAPDFTGVTADGKKVSLASLKGKLVYIDVWATWCGPCRDEFPDSKKLVKEFEGNDQVVFLYVSVDRDLNAWKKLLKDQSIPAGNHINQQTDIPGSIWEKYYLWGIPRYILINSDGTMLETHAPRPSSGKVAELIRSHLKTV